MAENYTPQFVGTFVNDTTAVSTVNNNFAAISAAFLDVLSRTGVAPNQMGSNLDMNGNQILNLPAPSTINSPARLIDIAGGNITVTTATTGTSGHTVPFLDGNNTWSGTSTWSLPSLGTSGGLTINETVTGSIPGGYNANNVQITDTGINAGSNFSTAWQVQNTFGGSSCQGGRAGVSGVIQINSATNAGNANKNYLGVIGTATVNSGDGGSSPTSFSTASGNFLGGLFQVNTSGSATSLLGVNALSGSISMASGSSAWQKTLLSLSSASSDVANGSVINAMIECFNETGATAKWTNALLIDNEAGSGSFPLSGSATIIKATGGSVATGIDFTGMVFSGNAFQSNAFAVTEGGTIATGAFGVNSGQINFNGITSGFLTLGCNGTSTLLISSQPIQIGVIGTTGGQLTLAGSTSGSAGLSCSATGGSLQLGGNNLSINSTGQVSTAGSFMVLANSTAPPSGGAAATGLFFGTNNQGIYFGTGAPTVSAAKGSLYLENGSGNLYINQSGSTTWVQITVP